MTDKIQHSYTNRVVCPHCGEVYEGSWEWDDNVMVETCEICGGEYKWEREVEVHYHSHKHKRATP